MTQIQYSTLLKNAADIFQRAFIIVQHIFFPNPKIQFNMSLSIMEDILYCFLIE